MSQITRAIVIAGGVGNRFSGHFIPKQFVEIEGKPVIAFTLQNVLQVPEIKEVVLVINKDYEQLYKDILKTYKLDGIRCIYGGLTRQQSIKSGIREAAGSDYVVVQNAVCPLTEPKLISEVLNQTISKNISTSAYIDVIDTVCLLYTSPSPRDRG